MRQISQPCLTLGLSGCTRFFIVRQSHAELSFNSYPPALPSPVLGLEVCTSRLADKQNNESSVHHGGDWVKNGGSDQFHLFCDSQLLEAEVQRERRQGHGRRRLLLPAWSAIQEGGGCPTAGSQGQEVASLAFAFIIKGSSPKGSDVGRACQSSFHGLGPHLVCSLSVMPKAG